MNKKQEQSDQTKKRVAEAARALFVQKGYKATSIEDIVAATGGSKGNIYYHFKSKEGLFLHLMEEWDREWEQCWLQKKRNYRTTVEKMYGLAELLVLEDLNHPLSKAADEFFNNEEMTTEVKALAGEMMNRHIQFNEQLIQEGIDGGEFRTDQASELAIVLEGLFIGLSKMSRVLPPESAIRLYRAAIHTFLNGIVRSSP
ncbi:TetR/AcrR family transcriptional regulator [Paenibacillus sp. NPDC058071]|uniref:TetR/AcrR family transcriptional regulator n=1 Tax=Paenibacillus sp. NPDC058071 TaxID=3346326 RepID=UPI0036D98EFE